MSWENLVWTVNFCSSQYQHMWKKSRYNFLSGELSKLSVFVCFLPLFFSLLTSISSKVTSGWGWGRTTFTRSKCWVWNSERCDIASGIWRRKDNNFSQRGRKYRRQEVCKRTSVCNHKDQVENKQDLWSISEQLAPS